MQMLEKTWHEGLNDRQREAATHGDGPLIIVAGAGTGKTKTLVSRVSHLIGERDVPPDRILLLTFTRRAAEEMLKRVASVIPDGSIMAKRVWGGTFHATANRLLRIYAVPAGLSPDFTIMDRTDSEDMLDVVRHELGFSQKERRFPRKSTCMDIYSRRVNGNEDLEAVLNKYFPWCMEWEKELNSLFREYAVRKQKSNVLDYDDLLLYWYFLLDDDAIAISIEDRFDHVLVDEYQDTNRIQAGILSGMRRKNRNITVVGDDAQSIYSFRSATVRNMLEFPEKFPAARVITLEQNYRSVQPILETTNRIIAQSRERFSKELFSEKKGGQRPQMITCKDEADQDGTVIKLVLEHYEQGIPLRKQAVLFRAASHSASLEIALAKKNIPFHKYGGLKFLEAAHIKDLVSLLRILKNPKDQMAWFRVLQLLDSVGPVTAQAVYDHLAENAYSLASVELVNAPGAGREPVAALGRLLKGIAGSGEMLPQSVIEKIYEFYRPILEKNYDNPVQRASDIEQLAGLASRYGTVAEFLADLTLDPPASTGDLAGPPTKDEDWLVLSTIHSAKGLEWDAVYLIHAADGFLPSDMSTGSDAEIQEELRLTYVATTRAKDFLYVMWPLRYYHRGRAMSEAHGYAQRCRFFTEHVMESMEVSKVEEPMVNGDGAVGIEGRADIGSKLINFWS